MAYEFLKGTSHPGEIILQAAMRIQVLATFCLILTLGSGKEQKSTFTEVKSDCGVQEVVRPPL
jgi:hypothetical protein